jgi:hypothetical protein
MLTAVTGLALAGALLAQALVTRRLWRSDLYEAPQKTAQTVLIWLLPVLGAAVVHAGLRQHEDVRRLPANQDGGEHASLWEDGPLGDDAPPPDPGSPDV